MYAQYYLIINFCFAGSSLFDPKQFLFISFKKIYLIAKYLI